MTVAQVGAQQRRGNCPAAVRAPIRVVMAGPLPPAVGGMASVIANLCGSKLRDAVTIELFDTGKQTPQGRSIVRAIAARLRLWRRWWSRLRCEERCVAHIHTCSGLSYFLDAVLVLLAHTRRVPVLLHIHGGRFDAFLDRLGPVRRRVAHLVARSAGYVVVLSDAWRERLEPRLPGARLIVVENGISLGPTVSSRAACSEPSVVFLGALCRAKGVMDLVQAAARLAHRARVVLLGPETESGIVEHLRRLAADAGIAQRVEFPGAVVGTAKAEWLARATIFVLPSHTEAQPIALLEAMAAGCAIVATAVGAIPDMIRDGYSGLLVEAGDVPALAAAIDRLLSDAGLREELGRRARLECAARFNIDRSADKLAMLYAQMC